MRANIGDTVIITNDDSPYYQLVGEVTSCGRNGIEIYLGRKYGWSIFESSEFEFVC
jgi:hypothetical protein